MKTALILFAPVKGDHDADLFMKSCISKVIAKGYTPVHSTVFSEYKSINLNELKDKLYSGIDAFFLFIDFGVTDLMYEIVASSYYRDPEAGALFTKELFIDEGWNRNMFGLNYFLTEISDITKIPLDVLKMKTRKREVVEARQFYFYRAKHYTKSSLASIGAVVGRDHATVLHGLKVVENTIYDKYQELFEGKKPDKKICDESVSKVIPLPEAVNEEQPAIENPVSIKVVKMQSPFSSVAAKERLYTGYRVHSF